MPITGRPKIKASGGFSPGGRNLRISTATASSRASRVSVDRADSPRVPRPRRSVVPSVDEPPAKQTRKEKKEDVERRSSAAFERAISRNKPRLVPETKAPPPPGLRRADTSFTTRSQPEAPPPVRRVQASNPQLASPPSSPGMIPSTQFRRRFIDINVLRREALAPPPPARARDLRTLDMAFTSDEEVPPATRFVAANLLPTLSAASRSTRLGPVELVTLPSDDDDEEPPARFVTKRPRQGVAASSIVNFLSTDVNLRRNADVEHRRGNVANVRPIPSAASDLGEVDSTFSTLADTTMLESSEEESEWQPANHRAATRVRHHRSEIVLSPVLSPVQSSPESTQIELANPPLRQRAAARSRNMLSFLQSLNGTELDESMVESPPAPFDTRSYRGSGLAKPRRTTRLELPFIRYGDMFTALPPVVGPAEETVDLFQYDLTNTSHMSDAEFDMFLAGILKKPEQKEEELGAVGGVGVRPKIKPMCFAVTPTKDKATAKKAVSKPLAQESPVCPICFDSFEEIKNDSARGLYSTTCGHLFCKTCLVASVSNSRSCPTCRTTLSLKQTHPVFF